MSEQWLSIVEYARSFNVSDMTIRRRIKTGKLQAVLRDGKYYIPVNQESASHESELRQPVHRSEDTRPLIKQRPSRVSPSVRASQEIPSVRAARPKPQQAPNNSSLGGLEAKHLPQQIADSLGQDEVVSVEAATLLSFCDNMVARSVENEKRQSSQYEAEKRQYEAELKAKDIEIKQLSQQVEDLQVLVKILERKQVRPD